MSVCPSVRPSIRSNHDCVRTQKAMEFKLCKLTYMCHRPVGIENGLYWFTGSGTSHITQTAIPGSWVYGKSDLHQISYLGLHTNC